MKGIISQNSEPGDDIRENDQDKILSAVTIQAASNDTAIIYLKMKNKMIHVQDLLKVYLHIGAGKTGTSAIQSFMNYNREKLLHEHSCLYPNFSSPVFKEGVQHNHCPIFKVDSKSLSGQIGDLLNYSMKENIKKVVLSCESLLDSPLFANTLFQALPDASNVRCIIVAYLRRQDHWLESAWKQWGIKNKKNVDIDDFIRGDDIISRTPALWLEHLHKWAEVFGKENVIVRPYEKEQLPEGLISNFLEIINIPYQENEWIKPPKSNLNDNFGFDPDIIELFKLNREFHNSIHDNRLSNFFSEYLSEDFLKSPFEPYSLLSPKQRIEIVSRFEPMNRRIAKEYVGREDGRLFYEPWPDPDAPWTPHEGLSLEKLVPIFAEILYKMDRKYQREFGLTEHPK